MNPLAPAVAMFKLAVLLLLGLIASLIAPAASAAFDVTSVTSEITLAIAAVAILGAAVLIVKVGIKAWKWIGRAM